jgi:hypothetical protein
LVSIYSTVCTKKTHPVFSNTPPCWVFSSVYIKRDASLPPCKARVSGHTTLCNRYYITDLVRMINHKKQLKFVCKPFEPVGGLLSKLVRIDNFKRG